MPTTLFCVPFIYHTPHVTIATQLLRQDTIIQSLSCPLAILSIFPNHQAPYTMSVGTHLQQSEGFVVVKHDYAFVLTRAVIITTKVVQEILVVHSEHVRHIGLLMEH